MITKHIGASMGYDRNDRRQHIASCAIVMDSQPASITKTEEAGHWHDLDTIHRAKISVIGSPVFILDSGLNEQFFR